MTSPSVAPPQDWEEASEAYNLSLQRAAQWYTTLGCQVLPLDIGKKFPTRDGWNLPESELIAKDPETAGLIWGGRFRGHGIGMYCSYESRTLILDIDVKNGAHGLKSLAEHQRKFGALPPTMRNNSPSGGYHLIYKVSDDWSPAKHKPARFAVNGMEILFNRRQAVMAPTRLADGGEYTPEFVDTVNRLPARIAVLKPDEVDALLYGKHLETEEERTTVWSEAHHGTFDGDTAERNALADQLIDALSQYPSDSFGKAIVETDCRRMREAGAGTRYPLLKDLAMHLCRACVVDGAVIKLDDALNDLMDAYRDAQMATNEWTPLEASNALDTMRWAITRPSTIESLMALDSVRGWAGAMTMPPDVAQAAQSAVSSTKASFRDKMRSKLQ